MRLTFNISREPLTFCEKRRPFYPAFVFLNSSWDLPKVYELIRNILVHLPYKAVGKNEPLLQIRLCSRPGSVEEAKRIADGAWVSLLSMCKSRSNYITGGWHPMIPARKLCLAQTKDLAQLLPEAPRRAGRALDVHRGRIGELPGSSPWQLYPSTRLPLDLFRGGLITVGGELSNQLAWLDTLSTSSQLICGVVRFIGKLYQYSLPGIFCKQQSTISADGRFIVGTYTAG